MEFYLFSIMFLKNIYFLKLLMHDIIKVVINMVYKWTVKRAFYVGR